jgi:Flp pilus assembly pilin Flp
MGTHGAQLTWIFGLVALMIGAGASVFLTTLVGRMEAMGTRINSNVARLTALETLTQGLQGAFTEFRQDAQDRLKLLQTTHDDVLRQSASLARLEEYLKSLTSQVAGLRQRAEGGQGRTGGPGPEPRGPTEWPP